MSTNWRRWIEQDKPKGVMMSAATHKRLKALSEETAMSMQFWTDAAMRFFLMHTGSAKLILSAKGVTLDEWQAREELVHNMIVELVRETTPIAAELPKGGGVAVPAEKLAPTEPEVALAAAKRPVSAGQVASKSVEKRRAAMALARDKLRAPKAAAM